MLKQNMTVLSLATPQTPTSQIFQRAVGLSLRVVPRKPLGQSKFQAWASGLGFGLPEYGAAMKNLESQADVLQEFEGLLNRNP